MEDAVPLTQYIGEAEELAARIEAVEEVNTTPHRQHWDLLPVLYPPRGDFRSLQTLAVWQRSELSL